MASQTDQELLKLCGEVYEKTGWDDKKMWSASWDALHYEQYKSESLIDPQAPLYNSDYILARLPSSRYNDTVRYDLTVQGDGRPKQLWFAGHVSGFGDDYFPECGEANTPLKALLKLTIALHEAGVLE